MKHQKLDRIQQIQESQYQFPYHYIPNLDNGIFSQFYYWSWGFRYFGGMQVVFDQLETLSFDSLVDIGCGDGRFLREASKRYSSEKLVGVDYSESAVKLAQIMNPHLIYKNINIIEEDLSEQFDIATLVEVLEHIPLNQVDDFLKAVANVLNTDGKLILTVPHANRLVENKHYQHFTSKLLSKFLEPYFQNIVYIPFDIQSKVMSLLKLIIGGNAKYFVLTNFRLTSLFYKLYIKYYLYTDNEQECGRIAAVCQKR